MKEVKKKRYERERMRKQRKKMSERNKEEVLERKIYDYEVEQQKQRN